MVDENRVYSTARYDKLYDNDSGKVIQLHRYKMEKFLGRKLGADEVVHHKDGNKKNNDVSNLVVMADKEHRKLHRKEFEHRRLAKITKYLIVDSLPATVEVGAVLSLRTQRHRKHTGIVCKTCGVAFWQRHDKQQVNCRACVFVEETKRRWKEGVYDQRAKVPN